MATKRKVSKILDSLAENDTESRLSKKPKQFLARIASAGKRHHEKALAKNTETKEEEKQPLDESTYAPWSRDQFLARLSTFQYKTWNIPYELTQISALECAKRGYKCTRLNTLQCTHCLCLLNINVGSDERIQQKMAEKYAEMLTTQHVESCPWRNRPCDEAIYTLPLTHAQKEQFFKRYDRLADNETIENYVFSGTNLNDRQLAKLSIDQLHKKAAVLALTGWDAETVGQQTLLSCSLCFRKIILNKDMNVVTEHMRYCPFVKQWEPLYNLVKPAHAQESVFFKADARATDEDQTRKSRLQKLSSIYFKRKT